MLLGSLADSLLVLLTFDKERAAIIRNVVGPELYGGPYRLIVSRLYEYIDKFKKPPEDHLPDLLSDILQAKDKQAELYTEIIETIGQARDTVNPDYTMNRLELFVKRQTMRAAAVSLAKVLQRDNEESLDEAEKILAQAGAQTLKVFDPGTQLSNARTALRFLERNVACFPTGIPELDRRGFGPNRKEVWLLIANTKSGKSWALTQLAKAAAIHKLKVSHITLEMSEELVSQRYMQAFFALAKRNEPVQIIKFKRDTLGRVTDFEDKRISPPLSLDDPKIKRKLEAKIAQWGTRILKNIIIKQFPGGQLTVRGLQAYLDNLSQQARFEPDLLIVDYPDLMLLDKNNYRLDLDETYKALRGLAVERNIALAIVSQSHRGAARSKLVRADNVAEAYLKIAHVDTNITYTQTPAEHKLGLARLFVAAGRGDADRFTLVISQNYTMGAFVVDSALMAGSTYWNLIPRSDEDEN
jgi:replicative DNA helicase